MITIKDLNRVFVTEEVQTRALNNINLDIREGEFVSIMGPSGCGKSTLLNIIGLLDDITSGSYQLVGQEVSGMNEKQRSQIRKANIGFIFQNFNLIDELNVFDNIELPLIYNRIPAEERKNVSMKLQKSSILYTVYSITPNNCRADSSNGWRWRVRSSITPK